MGFEWLEISSGPFVEESDVAFTKDRKTGIIGTYRTHDSDTGSPEVQVALLSERINYLTEHSRSTRRIITRAAAC